jgi:hypothetical protein
MPDFEPQTTSPVFAGTDRAERSSSPSFLEHIDVAVSQTRQRIEDISAKLSNAGFFGPPEEASKVGLSSEDNRRNSISDELARTERVLAIIEHQLKSLV